MPSLFDQVSPFLANGLATESGTGKGGKGGKAAEMLISSVGGCWREGAVTAVDHAKKKWPRTTGRESHTLTKVRHIDRRDVFAIAVGCEFLCFYGCILTVRPLGITTLPLRRTPPLHTLRSFFSGVFYESYWSVSCVFLGHQD